VEGIKAATLPGPGFYYKMYNTYYTADKMMDDSGKNISAADLDLTVYANVHRFIWGTGAKVLGADLIVDAIIPLVYTDISINTPGGRVEENSFNLGDINLEPAVLSWHRNTFDAAAGIGFFAPTGKYDAADPSSAGKDMWTTMLTLGGTLYFDEEKTWTASILARYETHTEKNDTKIKPGDEFHFEWGIGKTLMKLIDVGVSGYCQWQITDDSGDGVSYDKSVHDRVFAAGPEIDIFIPQIMSAVSLKCQKEFGAVDRSEGYVANLSLTKIF
ncbi:MAG TPA: transporter, partial [Spirochaetota bacterium]|nr:transporter [Spirochaetota bacterium]